MSNNEEIRDFLASRRARITPEQAGLPAYGGRRPVPWLRREEVALLAGISVEYSVAWSSGLFVGLDDGHLVGRRAPAGEEVERIV